VGAGTSGEHLACRRHPGHHQQAATWSRRHVDRPITDKSADSDRDVSARHAHTGDIGCGTDEYAIHTPRRRAWANDPDDDAGFAGASLTTARDHDPDSTGVYGAGRTGHYAAITSAHLGGSGSIDRQGSASAHQSHRDHPSFTADH
jgi:hypothetical protein